MAEAIGVVNRVVEVAACRPHPMNYNRHDEGQIADLRLSLRTFGQVRSIVVQDDTAGGFLIVAGHGLLAAAKLEGLGTLRADVIPGDWAPAKVLAYLAADNELGRRGDVDVAQLAVIVAQVREEAGESLAKLAAGSDEMLAALRQELDAATAASGAAGESEGERQPELTRYDVPDAIFATNNEWGVPLLDAKLQAMALVAPVQAWGQGAGARARTNRGTWHFYTEDYRFQALWDDPSPVVNSGCVAVVEPNFSCYIEMAPAVALWRIYQKRWLARWWQSLGIRVFVDLNVAEVHGDLNLLGVPKGWKAWATRGYAERMDATVREWERAVAHAGTDGILFFVYGGGKAVKQLCQERGWLWMIEQRDAAKVVSNG